MSFRNSSTQICRGDRIIVVIGAAGVGKTTFIQYATGESNLGVSDGILSGASEIRCTRMRNKPMVFIDTPGINETHMSATDVLLMVLDFLKNANERNIDTILYLHRISDNRISGPTWRSFESFASLCYRTKMPVVVLVTTMWKHVPPQVGADRETQLVNEFWGDMIENKCAVKRFEESRESAWRLLESNEETSTSKELEHPRNIQSNEAGVALNKQLEKLIRDQKRASRRVTTLADNGGSQAARRELTKRVEDLDSKIVETTQRMRELSLPIRRRILRWFNRNWDTLAIRNPY
ncbi:hypothetical protein CPB86DRAFT_813558 [Serendipita vermifera]|nr:hypothetical protein CPB86DRAFT_813558 [Serendipita vermifera]